MFAACTVTTTGDIGDLEAIRSVEAKDLVELAGSSLAVDGSVLGLQSMRVTRRRHGQSRDTQRGRARGESAE